MLQSVPHPIVQSPARLGLSNPNSPSIQSPSASKLSSQIPQSSQSHQQSNLFTTKTTSSALLPLLPPLPRAQTLLLQMASLASKLFEVSPNRSLWLSSFRGALPTFLSPQTQSMTPPPLDSTPSTTKEILALLTSLQTQLLEAVAELQEILDLQDAKQKTTREIQSKDSTMLAFANKLKEAERVLDILVDDYADYRRPKRSKAENDADDSSGITTVASQLKLSEILSYAHKISYTTFAPPEFGAGQAPLRGALPPAPQEEQMRASQLYAFADLDVGIPKMAEDKEIKIEPLIETPLAPSADANLTATQGLIPPPGWKPGMPVELPTDLPLPPHSWKPGMPVELPGSIPLPPPGWKPGMPVELPGNMSLPRLDPLSLPARVEDPASRPPPIIPKAQEPIMVAPVQLDILADEDDSSDYDSSEDGSSDED